MYVAVASASAQNGDGSLDLSSMGRIISIRVRLSRSATLLDWGLYPELGSWTIPCMWR
jgi:hypothetical protein